MIFCVQDGCQPQFLGCDECMGFDQWSEAPRTLIFCVQDGCQPLFLGCDVLSGLSISAKNRCRVHARFAKQGLATKLEFSGKFTFYSVGFLLCLLFFFSLSSFS